MKEVDDDACVGAATVWNIGGTLRPASKRVAPPTADVGIRVWSSSIFLDQQRVWNRLKPRTEVGGGYRRERGSWSSGEGYWR